MRLISLLVTAFLMATPTAAPAAQSSSAGGSASPATDAAANAGPPEGPVSLDRIRDALDRPAAPGQLLRALDKQPDFRVDVREKRKLEELIASLDFKSSPTPAGGIYAYEQQRMLVPPVDNPLAQPYSAFNQGQLLTILAENLAGKYLAEKAVGEISKAQRDTAVAAARREVEEAITDYCSGKVKSAGIQLCSDSATAPTSTNR